MTESAERRASWLELFYDLLFVVLVAQLAHPLAGHPAWGAGAQLLILFLPAWWMWVGATLYANLAGGGSAGGPAGGVGAERRLDVLVQMAILLVMAGTATQAAHGHPAMFAGAYAASRLQLLLMRTLKRGKLPAGGARWPLLVSAALWIGSIAVPPPATYALWVAGLLVEIVPLLTRRRHGSEVRERLAAGDIAVSHLVERFGLFMIIVFGESIAQIVAAVAKAEATPVAVATGLAAFTVVAVLWWLYFDFGSAVAEKAMAARREQAARLTLSIFVVGHFLPVVSLLAFAAGLNGLITAAAAGHHAGDALRLCAIALAGYLLNNAVLGLVEIRQPLRRILSWLLPNLALLLALALLADRLPPAVPLLLIAFALALEIIPGVRRRTTE